MNLKYLAYNFLKTDYKTLNIYINNVSEKKRISKYYIYKDVFYCFFKYDTRFLDYFYFKFFNEEEDRELHTNVWDMYKFQSKYNSSKQSIILRNKGLFRERYDKFFTYPSFFIKQESDIESLIFWIEENKFKKIVVKEPLGAVGKGVEVLNVSVDNKGVFVNEEPAYQEIKKWFKKGFFLFESFIQQHPTLSKFNPKAINTIRIVTFLNKENKVEFWGGLIRISYDKNVDNFDAGGLSDNIDLKTGKINSKAVIKDPFCKDKFEFHPITKAKIYGVEIPFWEKVIEMAKDCALELPAVRTVGWDIAITEMGPTIIEGNDNWDKTHFEMATQTGLKNKIKNLLNEK